MNVRTYINQRAGDDYQQLQSHRRWRFVGRVAVDGGFCRLRNRGINVHFWIWKLEPWTGHNSDGQKTGGFYLLAPRFCGEETTLHHFPSGASLSISLSSMKMVPTKGKTYPLSHLSIPIHSLLSAVLSKITAKKGGASFSTTTLKQNIFTPWDEIVS